LIPYSIIINIDNRRGFVVVAVRISCNTWRLNLDFNQDFEQSFKPVLRLSSYISLDFQLTERLWAIVYEAHVVETLIVLTNYNGGGWRNLAKLIRYESVETKLYNIAI